MILTGKNIIDNNFHAAGDVSFMAYNPLEEKHIEPAYYDATSAEINLAVEKAKEAFEVFSGVSNIERTELLENIADEVEKLGHKLIERAMTETALSETRLIAERERTLKQLRLFANLISDAGWVEARIDVPEDKDFEPVSNTDIRQMHIPLGPVVVFTASNFPLAFSVAGGDTAAAFAAGCPVIVKAHPYQPGTSEMLGKAVLNAIIKCNLPTGIFALIHGNSHEVGKTLVAHPHIKAGAFTGSFSGGKALFDIAVNRPEPIPFFAEMGSTNPVFFLPKAIELNHDIIAEQYVNSVNLGVGQFCTNPGLAFVFDTPFLESFVNKIKYYISQAPAGTMLSPFIKAQLEAKLNSVTHHNSITLIAKGNQHENTISPYLYSISANDFLALSVLQEEFFGPVSFLVILKDEQELMAVISVLKGQLTSSIHSGDEDMPQAQKIIEKMKFKSGRLIINGFPTGVEVCHAMHHGGPFPASTDPYYTSVGTSSVKRFVRPVCLQNFPDALLPEELKDDNSQNIWRLVNGNLTKKSL